MPSNKKPRKPHRPIKIRLPGSHYSDAMVTELKSIVNRTALIIEITLPRGDATDDPRFSQLGRNRRVPETSQRAGRSQTRIL